VPPGDGRREILLIVATDGIRPAMTAARLTVASMTAAVPSVSQRTAKPATSSVASKLRMITATCTVASG
jgi:hypothetical protein